MRTEKAIIAALDRIHGRLTAAQAWDELEVIAGMSDTELLVLADLEIRDAPAPVLPRLTLVPDEAGAA